MRESEEPGAYHFSRKVFAKSNKDRRKNPTHFCMEFFPYN
jgi:hypothetical protein